MVNIHYFLLAVMTLSGKAGGFFSSAAIAMLLLNLLVLYIEVWFLYLTNVVVAAEQFWRSSMELRSRDVNDMDEEDVEMGKRAVN
jgi:hypothetical protein